VSAFRLYEPRELGADGYPLAWHETIKHVVREEAGHRCIRCGHPFIVGESGVMEGPHASAKGFAADIGVDVEELEFFASERPTAAELDAGRRTNWSACDEQCTHAGPARARRFDGETGWSEIRFTDEWPTAGEWAARLPQVQAAWRILTVHHLDQNKANCRWWNLTSLCQRCHLYIQRTVQMERVYPWAHDDWFKPYAAGWYAHAYLGEDLTREETLARLDELLALERVA